MIDTGCTKNILNSSLVTSDDIEPLEKPRHGVNVSGGAYEYSHKLKTAGISFINHCGNKSQYFGLHDVLVRPLNIGIDMLLGLDFLLHDDGGLILSKDYVQIYKGALLTPNHPFPLEIHVIPSESPEKHGGCKCQDKGSCQIQDQGKFAILLNKNSDPDNYFEEEMIICLEDYETEDGVKPEILFKTLITIEIDDIVSHLEKLGIIGEDAQKYWYIDKPICQLKIKKTQIIEYKEKP